MYIVRSCTGFLGYLNNCDFIEASGMYAVVNNYLCNYVSEQRYVNCVELNVDKMPRHKVSNATYVQRVLSWKNYITKSSL